MIIGESLKKYIIRNFGSKTSSDIFTHALEIDESNKEKTIYIVDEVINWLNAWNIMEYSVKLIDVSDDNSGNKYCLCVAWISRGHIETLYLNVYSI